MGINHKSIHELWQDVCRVNLKKNMNGCLLFICWQGSLTNEEENIVSDQKELLELTLVLPPVLTTATAYNTVHLWSAGT